MIPGISHPKAAMRRAALCVLPLALSFLSQRAQCADAPAPPTPVVTNDSEKWIAAYGENIWAQFHPDWEGWFPGGHSNRFHQAYVMNAWNHHPTTKDWTITNKRWIFDGEWFAVEWFYQATYTDDGFQDWESTLGIGHLKDGKMISWTEYFDHSVGKLQHLRLMPLYDITEAPFPWPSKAILRMPYRP